MNPVGVVDLVGFLAILTALVFLRRGWKRALERDAKLLLAGLFALTLFHSFSNVLEWAGITEALAPFEDFVQLLEPMLWGFFFYGFLTAVDIAEQVQIKEALRESEERYRTVADFAYNWEYWVGPDLNYIYVSPSCERITGYRAEEFLQDADLLKQIVHHDDLTMVLGHRHEVLESGDIAPIDFRVVTRSGQERWISHVCQPVYSSDGRYLGRRGSNRDITERVRAEEALRESEAHYHLLAENITDIIWTTDMNLRFTYLSPSVTDIGGYSVDEAMALSLNKVLTPASFAIAMETFREELAVEKTQPGAAFQLRVLELEQRRKDGSTIWTEVTTNFLRDPEGQPIGIVGVTRDITERKQVEEERALLLTQIREQAQRVQQIIDTVPEGVLLLDPGGRVILANPLGEKELIALADAREGEPLTHLGDRPLAELLTSPPKGLWHEVATDGRRFEAIARPLEAGPEPGGWVLVIRDVTREREIQERVQQQDRLAVVGQLAAGIAHDFNNIMGVIVLYTHIALNATPDLSPKSRDRLTTVVQQAKQASELVQQILDFGRQATIERRPLDLVPLLQEQVKLLRRTLPENIKIELVHESDDLDAALIVNADPTRVQQVVLNLALNARDAMPDGGELRIGLAQMPALPLSLRSSPPPAGKTPDGGQGGAWVRVTVADSGTGISPDVLAHIYEPFFTTKEPGQGTGLGLAQVYGIVKQHEGEIDVQTQMGADREQSGGTTFSVYLPALAVERSETADLKADDMVQGQGETILVVEDNARMREALVAILETLGYRALGAANGQEALAVVERHTEEIKLVLSDVVMPEMGGIALFHALRQRGLTTPVVLLTGHTMENELKRLRAAGLSSWLFKPPNVEQLARMVARVLGIAAH